MTVQPTVDELVVADPPERWSAAGFHIEGDLCEVGTVRIRLEGPGERRGIVAWSVRDLASDDLDGLPTRVSGRPPAAGGPHPNGSVTLDHLVVMSPALDRTAGALEAAGLDLRRLREGDTPGGSSRQAFFRMGEVILEVAGPPQPSGDEPARFWGLVVVVPDVDALAAGAERGLFGEPRAAVQEGRRIVTVRRDAGLSVALAFLTP
jgi:hypothetical protein